MLPDGWSETNISKVIDVRRGFAFKSSQYTDQGHKILRVTNIKGDGVITLDKDVKFLDDGEARSFYPFLVNEGDVLLVMVGATTGKIGIVSGENLPALLNQNLWALRTKSKELDQRFFGHALKLHISKFLDSQQGSAREFLTQKGFGGLSFPLPPLPEQKRIAEVLGSVDAAIEATKAVIDQTKTVKQGLLQTLLTRGIGHTKFKDSPLGEIPESWEIVKLSVVVKRTQLGGNYANSTENAETGYPLIKMGNLGRGRINLNKIEYTETKEEVKSSDYLKDGDVLFNTRNTLDLVGKVAIWRSELKRAAFNSNILRLKFRDELATNEYMNYFFNSSRGIFELRKRAVGTTSVAAIYWRDCEGIELPLPPVNEQMRIVTTLESLENEIQIESEKLSALQLAKSGLMKDLLTGKVRIHA